MNDCAILGGAGAVGSAIAEALSGHYSVQILDVKQPQEPQPCGVLHVALRWSDDFLATVLDCIHATKPSLVIVHSTVPVGTTRRLGENAVHSPVRGQHDLLGPSLYWFVKYVAGPQAAAAKAHLEEAGLRCDIADTRPETTELAKLLCLSRLLSDLAWYEFASQQCAALGVSRDFLHCWTRSYNSGYGDARFTRAELQFPDGAVGGHCVWQGSTLLDHPYIDHLQDIFPLMEVEHV